MGDTQGLPDSGDEKTAHLVTGGRGEVQETDPLIEGLRWKPHQRSCNLNCKMAKFGVVYHTQVR